MNWRLGLDLGTNSIGWSVFSIDKSKVPSELVDLGVRIFSDGRDPKSKEPLAVERRTARGQRKIIYRRKIRRRKTFRLLQSQGLFPAEKEASKKIKSFPKSFSKSPQLLIFLFPFFPAYKGRNRFFRCHNQCVHKGQPDFFRL